MTHVFATPADRRRRASERPPVDLEIVIPALNEEYRLPTTLHSVLATCDRLQADRGVTARIVVVDNGSHDRTAEVADRISLDHPGRVVVLGCAIRGKGAAVRRGVVGSRSSAVGFLDADLAVPADALVQVVDELGRGADVVIGSRRCEGARYVVRQSLVRRAGSNVFRRAIAPLVPTVTDTQCGFKFFSAEAASNVFADLSTAGFSFDVELLARASAMGFSIKEIPVEWTDGAASTLRPFAHGGQIARELIHLRKMSRDGRSFVA